MFYEVYVRAVARKQEKGAKVVTPLNPIMGGGLAGTLHGGGWVDLPTPIIFRNFAPFALKLGSLVGNRTRNKKLFGSIWFP